MKKHESLDIQGMIGLQDIIKIMCTFCEKSLFLLI